ncbi:MAG TPA: hypothetical protein PKE30_01545 [Niabella sp.]|nr:hypothetical protein [Niabella sp.]
MFYTYREGWVHIRFSRSDNTLTGAPVIGFKVVLIPGTLMAIAQKTGVDLKNYVAVKTSFGLKD